MNPKILVVDDDVALCQLIKKYGEQRQFTVDLVHTGLDGLNQAISSDYQLIILDVMLPIINGFDVLSEIRKKDGTPILMLTAKDMEADKIKGLAMGADDYLTKPFSLNELMARAGSLIRRYTLLNQPIEPADSLIKLQGMVIDESNRLVLVNGNPVVLTAKEFDLLFFLASNKGKIFTKKQLYMAVWQDEYAFDDSNIMSFVSKLRKKIEENPNTPFYIQTIRGVGYRFNQGAAL